MRRSKIETEGTIIHVRKFDGRWKATQTTADCKRFIRQCGEWPTLAEAVPFMRPWHEAGVLSLQATAAEIAEAKAVQA